MRRDGAAPVGRRLDRHRQPRTTASAPSTSRSTPPGVAAATASTSTTPTTRATGTPSGRPRSPTTGHGYSAEFRIPLSMLRFAAAAGAELGLSGAALHRRAARRPTTGRSSRGSAASYVPLFGRSTTWSGCRRGAASSCGRSRSGARATAPPSAAPARSRTAPTRDATAGLDAKAHLTQRADAGPHREPRLRPGRGRHRRSSTCRRYETFFPEKRPFFLEGIDTFADAPPQLLYTRRIGHQPARAGAERRRDAGRRIPSRHDLGRGQARRARSGAGPPSACCRP